MHAVFVLFRNIFSKKYESGAMILLFTAMQALIIIILSESFRPYSIPANSTDLGGRLPILDSYLPPTALQKKPTDF